MDLAKTLMEKGSILLDGATGTLLWEAGLPVLEGPCWDHPGYPDAIGIVQRGYREAGAEVITADTFMANEALPGGDEAVAAMVRRAVEDARVNGAGAIIALSVGMSADIPEEEAARRFASLIGAGAEAGVGLILVETMTQLPQALTAVRAAQESCNLPVFCTLASPDGETVGGVSPLEAIRALEDAGVFAAGFNCAPDALGIESFFAQVGGRVKIPLIAQPSAGVPEERDGIWRYPIGPEEFAEKVAALERYGVKFFGGCCGTTPAYIRALKERLV